VIAAVSSAISPHALARRPGKRLERFRVISVRPEPPKTRLHLVPTQCADIGSRPDRTGKPRLLLSCYQAVDVPRLVSRALSFDKLRSGKNQVRCEDGSFRADSSVPKQIPVPGRTCALIEHTNLKCSCHLSSRKFRRHSADCRAQPWTEDSSDAARLLAIVLLDCADCSSKGQIGIDRIGHIHWNTHRRCANQIGDI
jgi:hypothetical protein